MSLYDALTDRDEEGLPRRQRNRMSAAASAAYRAQRLAEEIARDPMNIGLRRETFVPPGVDGCLRYEGILECDDAAYECSAVAPDADQAKALILDAWKRHAWLPGRPLPLGIDLDEGTPVGRQEPRGSYVPASA